MNIMLKFCTYTWMHYLLKSWLICIHVFNLKTMTKYRTHDYNIDMKSKIIVKCVCVECSSYD